MELIRKSDALHAVLHNTGDAAVAAVQNIKPINPHGELREMLIDEIIDRIGEWEERYIEDANPLFRRRFYCSRCGEWTTHGKTRYCPNCGCRMDGETEQVSTYSLGKISVPNGAIKQIIADGKENDNAVD